MQQSISNPREKNDSIDLQQETVYENFPVVENLTLKEKEAKPVIIEITETDQTVRSNPPDSRSIVLVEEKSLTKQVEELLLTKPDLMSYSQKVVSLC